MWPVGSVETEARERRWLAWIIALHLLAISLPYLWAWAITPPGYEYLGLLYNADDQNVHLAWARQTYEGHFFLRDLFTHETLTSGERPLFNNLFTALIGVLSRITGAPLIVFYHLLRLVFAALLLIWFYALSAQIINDWRVRVVATGLAAFSGGTAWIAGTNPGEAAKNFFLDWPGGASAMPEAFTFISALIFPLFIASMALLTLVYALVLRAQTTGNWRFAAGAGVAALLLGNIHTYDVLPLNVTLLLWAAWSWKTTQNRNRMAWAAPIIAVLSTLPPLLYQYFVFLNSTEFQVKALTRTAPPPLLSILGSYAPLLLLALAGAWWLRKNERAPLLMLWPVVTFLMIFAPVSFGRKMIEGVHLPLCFLAAAGLVFLADKIPFSARRIVAGAVAGVLCLSSLNFVRWCLANAQENNISRAAVFQPPLYLSQSDFAALEYLRDLSTRKDTAVLSLPYAGNYLPRVTGRVAYVAHWAETLNFFDAQTRTGKIVEAQRFYGLGGATMTADEARDWLQENRIGYVIIGEYEQGWGAKLPLELPIAQTFPGAPGQPSTMVYEVPRS